MRISDWSSDVCSSDLPVASVLLLKFEQLESRYLDRSTSMLAVSKNGLWLRQADDRGQSVIHALSVSNKDMVLNDVIIFLYEGTDRFAGRIDAEHAQIGRASGRERVWQYV